MNEKMDEVCGYFDVDVDGRFEHLRYEETNCGNLVADMIRTEFDICEIVLLNCGTLRSNSIMTKGDVTNRNIAELLPMIDKIRLLKIPGDILLQLLENGVSKWPTLDGRFLSVSGLKFSFDPD